MYKLRGSKGAAVRSGVGMCAVALLATIELGGHDDWPVAAIPIDRLSTSRAPELVRCPAVQ